MSEVRQQHLPYPGCSPAKAEGAFVALAAGDALGWPQELRRKAIRPETPVVSPEFREWVRRSGGQFYPHEEIIGAGEYSDDTQLMLAVARSRLLAGSAWWTALTRTELPLWTLYERGGGGATKRAASSWAQGVPPWQGRPNARKRYFEAGGNGVAMRVIPHAVFFAGEPDAEQLMHDVVMDGTATHGHPRALVGAAAYAFAAWWLLRVTRTVAFGELADVLLDEVGVWGAFPTMEDAERDWFDAANSTFAGVYEKVWKETVSETCNLLQRVQMGLQDGAIADTDAILKDLGTFGKSKGSGTISVAAAIYLMARYAAAPTQAVLRAAFAHGADTDTIAAMVGGLAGCLTGTDWMPRGWSEVQDCQYLRDVASKVAKGPSAAIKLPPALKELKKKQLDAICTALVEGHEGNLDLDGIRKVEVIKHREPRALAKTIKVDAWLLRATDGQTLYVTKCSRRPKDGGLSAYETGTHASARNNGGGEVVGVRLSVRDLDSATSFYQQAFDLNPLERAKGFVNFGRLSLVDIRWAQKLSHGAIADESNGSTSMIEICVPDLQNSLMQVKRAGGRILHDIKDTSSGRRCFRCADPDGNILEAVERNTAPA